MKNNAFVKRKRKVKYKVFIICAEKDIPRVEGMCGWLADANISSYLYCEDRMYGDCYLKSICNAINSCLITLVVLSSNANESSWVQNELVLCYQKEKWIIPFYIEDVKLRDELELLVCRLRALKAIDPPLENYKEILIATIKEIIRRISNKRRRTGNNVSPTK